MIVYSEIMVLHATKIDVLKFHKFELISSCATKLIKFFKIRKKHETLIVILNDEF